MAEKKKILVMVASPKKERSGTLIPTKAFVQGLEENGDYETEYLFIDNLNIKPCRGCLSCWGRPDGSCFMKDDDIPWVREKLINSDIVIWSFPLFLFSIPGQMKVLMDRIVGMVHPFAVPERRPENHLAFKLRLDGPGRRLRTDPQAVRHHSRT